MKCETSQNAKTQVMFN